jgi:hypothetical protein
MATIQISILPDLTPIDQYEEDDDGKSCPLPTKDADLNEANKQQAIEEADYRDPADGGAFRLSEVCGNCKAYDQTDDMLDCIGDDSGDLGYCQLYKFVCKATHVCDDWVEGGPITSDSQQSYRDNL